MARKPSTLIKREVSECGSPRPGEANEMRRRMFNISPSHEYPDIVRLLLRAGYQLGVPLSLSCIVLIVPTIEQIFWVIVIGAIYMRVTERFANSEKQLAEKSEVIIRASDLHPLRQRRMGETDLVDAMCEPMTPPPINAIAWVAWREHESGNSHFNNQQVMQILGLTQMRPGSEMSDGQSWGRNGAHSWKSSNVGDSGFLEQTPRVQRHILDNPRKQIQTWNTGPQRNQRSITYYGN
jgi:hypothetical protein